MCETAEPIVMPFALWTSTGPRNRELNGSTPDTPREGAILGKGSSIVKYREGLSAASCAEAAEPIDLPFGLLIRVGRRKHKFIHESTTSRGG